MEISVANPLSKDEIMSSLRSTANDSMEMCQKAGIDQQEMIAQGQWMMQYCKKLYHENRPQFTVLANDLLQACPGLVCFFSQFPDVHIAFHTGTRVPLLYF